MIDGLVVGAILALAMAISVFFLKFWRTTRDQIFLAFALVFAMEGATRLLALLVVLPSDRRPFIYLLRLCGYLVLIVSIFVKNRPPPKA